jgi:hypothetical protein
MKRILPTCKVSRTSHIIERFRQAGVPKENINMEKDT